MSEIEGAFGREKGKGRPYSAVTTGSAVYSYATAPHMQEPVVMFAVFAVGWARLKSEGKCMSLTVE